MVNLFLAWTSYWTNNWSAVDLRCHYANVTSMMQFTSCYLALIYAYQSIYSISIVSSLKPKYHHADGVAVIVCTVSFFFYLRPVLVFYSGIVIACCLSMCPCVHPCVSSKLVRTITCHTFKLDSPNLDQNCKNTLAKIPIVLGVHLPWTSRSNLTENQNLFHFVLLQAISHHWQKLKPTNSDER